ncbi:VOC family protein [Neptuniibacter sp. QD72_48]|uniref:VOC family protein n=1 Tax=Neptuniibacter sp. QD72_48 TaxID=3398214 RepID=UPI0039F5C04C
MTDDVEAATTYYEKVIGWEVERVDMGDMIYRVLKVDGNPVGGIMPKLPESEGVPNHWGTYITVDDVDATLALAEANGGKAIYPPMDVPDVGRMCAIMDNTGAVVSVITYAETAE